MTRRQQRLAEVISFCAACALSSARFYRGYGNCRRRPVTTIFVQFDYKNRRYNSSAIETADLGQQLQAYYQWACEVVSRFGQENARVNRVLTGDKGNQLHIMLGAPVAPVGAALSAGDAAQQAGFHRVAAHWRPTGMGRSVCRAGWAPRRGVSTRWWATL